MMLCSRERHKELAWLTPVPESHKLTDSQVMIFGGHTGRGLVSLFVEVTPFFDLSDLSRFNV